MVRRTLLAATALLVLAPAAHAVPDCEGAPFETSKLVTGESTLESIIVHPNGKLYFSNTDGLLRLDSPDAEPVMHAPIEEPGGIAVEPDGTIVIGSGNSIPNGQVGDATGPSSLLRVNPVTGETKPFATGLSMGNGVDRGPDGHFYASNDFGMNIDRISPDGETERGWSKVDSGNGLQVDSTGRWLFVNQTFRPAAIQRVDLSDPTKVTPFVTAPAEDTAAGLDGMDRDAADNLYVTGNGNGTVYKVTKDAEMCAVLRGLPAFPDGPSAVSVGVPNSAFPAENLYVVAFNGELTEIKGVATPPADPKLKLTVKPRKTRVGKRTTFNFKVSSDGAPVFGAVVRFVGQRISSGRDGKARVRHRFRSRGRKKASVSKPGYKGAKLTIRVQKRK